MLESYTESADRGLFVTLIPRDGIDALHVGVVSLPLRHPDAHLIRFSYMRHKIETTAALIRAGEHIPLCGVFSLLDHADYEGRFNICYEFAESDATSALIELRHIAQQLANRDTLRRRLARWFGLGVGK